LKETARLADQVNGVIRETIPKDELTTVLDNIGLPYAHPNLTYSNGGHDRELRRGILVH